jgi:hypothetical protein
MGIGQRALAHLARLAASTAALATFPQIPQIPRHHIHAASHPGTLLDSRR